MTHTETMTPRERMHAALSHETPDRVPIDLGGFQSGIHARAYSDLLGFYGMVEPIAILDPVQQLARPSERILERFHVDTRYVGAHGPQGFPGGIEQNIREGRLWHDLRDEFGVVWSMPDDQGLYMDITHHPLANASVADVERYPYPDGSDPTRFTGVREHILHARETTPYALCTCIGGVVYEICWYMRGLERWFMDTIENVSFCEAALDQTLRFWTDFYTGFLREAGDIVDVIMIGDDLAGQSGPLFNPVFYRKVVKPRQKKLVQHIKSLSNAKVWYHTCGDCSAYISDLIDNGIDILNPVQIGPPAMEPSKLKREYGRNLVFWGGGIDAQHILPFERPSVVREHVRNNIGRFMPGGGYVFNNVHNIQYGVPPENVEALFDAAYEFGFYE
jgi:uroporphyrinogen decarboxylase